MKERMRGREEGLQLFTHTQSRSLSIDRCTPLLFAPLLLPNREAFPQTLTTIRSSLSIDEVVSSLLISPSIWPFRENGGCLPFKSIRFVQSNNAMHNVIRNRQLNSTNVFCEGKEETGNSIEGRSNTFVQS